MCADVDRIDALLEHQAGGDSGLHRTDGAALALFIIVHADQEPAARLHLDELRRDIAAEAAALDVG